MKKQHGFSMIEVLVAVVVLVFGVLGMAGLQMQAINATEQGRYNSIAAMQATSIAAAIKANPGYWGSPPNSIQVQGTTFTGGPAASTAQCSTTDASPVVCNPIQMAYYDLAYWGTQIAATLPVGNFAIACNSTASPAICTITIFWKEKNVAGRSQEAVGGTFGTFGVMDHSYQTVVTSL